MKKYSPGDSIKFKTPTGLTLEGKVYDCNEYALIVINNIHGQYVIDYKDIVCNIPNIDKSKEEWEYYAAYNGQVVGQYSPSKTYSGAFGYLSPDVDDDGC